MKIFATLVMVLLLTACGGSETVPEGIQKAPEELDETVPLPAEEPVDVPDVETVTEGDIQDIEAEIENLDLEEELDFSDLDGLEADLDLI